MTTPNVLRDVEIVHLDFTIFTGQRKLEPGDFDRVRPGDLPDQNVASLGSKKTVDPEALTPLNNVRYRAEKLCLENGVRFMGAYAIPQSRIALVSEELAKLVAEFRQKKDQFIADYDELVDEWILKNPKFEDQIRRAKLPAHVVRSRFHAGYTVYRVMASDLDTTSSLSGASGDLLDKVLGGLLTDLGGYVAKAMSAGVAGNFRVEVRRSVQAAAEKIRRFGFLTDDGSLDALAQQLLNAVTGSGQIAGDQFKQLKSLLEHLQDLDGLKRHLSTLGHVIVPVIQPAPTFDLPTAPAAAAIDAAPVLAASAPDLPVQTADEGVKDSDPWTDPWIAPAPVAEVQDTPVPMKKAAGLRVSSLSW